MEKNKVLLILHGESFRSGGTRATRIRGTGDYYEKQRWASESHLKLIDVMEKNNFVDVIINTHYLNEEDDQRLLDLYEGKNIIMSNFYKSIKNDEGRDILIKCYDIINNISDNYEHIIMVRIDLYLKEYFLNIFSLTDRIYFTHIDSNLAEKNGNFNVCYDIMVFPKKFYSVFENKLVYNHTHSIKDSIKEHVGLENIDYFVYSLHICSTDLGWNPIYIQVDRKINNSYEVTGKGQKMINYFYDREKDIFIKDNRKYLELKNNIK